MGYGVSSGDDLHLDRNVAKAFSTFYTRAVNATLLAELVISLPNSSWKLDESSFYDRFRAVDFACGGGMLLLAACRALGEHARTASTINGSIFDPKTFFHAIIEHGIHGFDVMEQALQFTRDALSRLGGDLSSTTFNLFHAPLEPPDRLGSLDLLKAESRLASDPRISNLEYSLVIMNPPFARSSGDNLQFGATANKKERMVLNRVLTKLRSDRGLQGIGQAGQAADFIVLALEKLEPGGRLAFVAPKSLIDGAAWIKLRRHLLDRASVELLAFTFTPPGFSFSENTSLSECLIIARKKTGIDDPDRTVIVNLFMEPRDDADAMALARSIIGASVNPGPSNAIDIHGQDGTVIANLFSVSSALLVTRVANWQQLFGLPIPRLHGIETDLIEASMLGTAHISIIRLGDIATIGPDRSELTKKTNIVTDPTSESIHFLWGRDNDKLSSFCTQSNQERSFKENATASLREKFASTTSHLLLPESIFLKTTSIFGCYCKQEVLSNVFWSCKAEQGVDIEKIIAMWSNSTIGILLLLVVRNEARGPWIHWKKVTLQEYRVPDFTMISGERQAELVALFDRYKDATFTSIFEVDATRESLDADMIALLCPDSDQAFLMAMLDAIRECLRSMKSIYAQ